MSEADGGVRRLVLTHGRDHARKMVEPEQKALVDIAAEVMGDEDARIGTTYAGFCLTALPHKCLPHHKIWVKHGHRVTLTVQPGLSRFFYPGGALSRIGVPYGARARIFLLYLQTQAIRTGSPKVELGRSMRDWLGRMGVSWGGESGKALREQVARIAACHLGFGWEDDASKGWTTGGFLKDEFRIREINECKHQLIAPWEDWVVIGDLFYKLMLKHPVPLREAALRELADRSASLDIYIWLAYRLHILTKRTPIRWDALREQFGVGKAMKNFRRDFRQSLAPAVAAYPEAKVEFAEDDSGLLIFPSRPPVAPKLITIR